MEMRERAPIHVRQRYKTTLPQPQGLAVAGARVFVSFRENPQIFSLDLSTSRCDVWAVAPNPPWGLAASEDGVWAVCGYGPNADRHVVAFDAAGNARSSPARCPDGTGSYIALDGRVLFLSQWYEQRVFRLTDTQTFEPVIGATRGICGIAADHGTLTLLTTADEATLEYHLERYDLADPAAGCVDVATVPFRARSLAWTGSEYLTSHREAGEIVAFSIA
jgi:hypothetical protein